jgi:hypothetical protein
LEVNEQGAEDFVCAAHTKSEKHVSVLPTGMPSAKPLRSRPLPDSASLTFAAS